MRKFIFLINTVAMLCAFNVVLAADKEVIKLVEITDIDHPYSAGSVLDTSGYVSNSSMSTIHEIEWVSNSSNSNTVKITVRPHINWKYDQNTQATVNGKSANFVNINDVDYDEGYLEIWYTFVGDSPVQTPSSAGTLTHAIMVYASKNGRIEPNTIRAPHRKNFTVQIIPDEGYEVKDVEVDGTSVGAVTEYTFRRVSTTHKIRATFKPIKGYVPGSSADNKDEVVIPSGDEEIKSELTFLDVKPTDWYYESVKFVCLNGIFKGYNENEFAPNDTMTRAMVAQVVYNLSVNNSIYQNTDSAGSYFKDVNSAAWFYKPIQWVRHNNIMNGYDNRNFGPNINITREQVCQILYSLEKNTGNVNEEFENKLSGYKDSESVSSYAINALNWAINKGVITGKDNNMLEPQGKATRVEIATMIMRYIQGR